MENGSAPRKTSYLCNEIWRRKGREWIYEIGVFVYQHDVLSQFSTEGAVEHGRQQRAEFGGAVGLYLPKV